MEAEQGYLTGARGARRTERVCTREEKKRRKTTGLAEDSASGQTKYPCFSSASSSSYDDRSSAASGLDVADRLTYLEQRMQMQEDEIQLLKLALADVLKRLNISEEHQAGSAAAAGRRTPGGKARPVSLALPPRTPMATLSAPSLKKSSTVPSSVTARNYSPTPTLSGAKSPPGSVKDSPCKTAKTRPPSVASVCKKIPEGSNKSSEAAVSAGTRRVTHCKVTMQIYLSPLARKTGSSEEAKSASAVPAYDGPVAGPGPPPTKRASQPRMKKSAPSFTLNLQKTVTSQSSAHETSSYISPVKSPSQYFQICY
ncbi:echinoderm microtubule-associated protein-like 1 isoform X3 [Fundulus heteroclitus]|uniref:echinoderm microtubule-associated protein-like 1 isoform X2 n=1 Tax=Fundulus heteroclitus TaxID=8078 RepID=UPI00165C34FE|nr:echinoderm microtubule-associated protein-like 1 isoform X2 [Fundulus heteroclitus]XP_035990085.1 echinoderm microtubule-associated protein-like 1 isoform X3 [Fundulus heteroclitus]